MWLKKLSLKSIKGVKNLDLDFSPGINILIGSNGTRKSTILKSIAIGMVNKEDALKSVEESLELFNVDSDCVSRFLFRHEESDYIVENDFTFQTTYPKKYQKDSTEVRSQDVAKKLREGFIGAYGPYRNINIGSLKNRKWNYKPNKTHYINSLFGIGDCYSSFNEYFWKISGSFKDQNGTNSPLGADILPNFFSKIESFSEILGFMPSTMGFSLKLSSDHESFLSFPDFPDGYRSILLLFLDILFSSTESNNSVDSLSELSGIVLIDEIELHLHPAAQKSILSALHETFPNIQFIVTTHSPLVVLGPNKANIISLKRSKKELIATPISKNNDIDSLNDVLSNTELFDVTPYSFFATETLKKYRELCLTSPENRSNLQNEELLKVAREIVRLELYSDEDRVEVLKELKTTNHLLKKAYDSRR